MEAIYQSHDPAKVRFFSCDFWGGSDAQCDLFQSVTGTTFPVLLDCAGLGASDQYNCSYHYVFVIDGDGVVAYRGSFNQAAIEMVVADAVERLDTQVAVGDVPDARPLLGAAYPNPFNPSTNVPYFVPDSAASTEVQLDVLDLRGRVVRTLVSGQRPAGDHVVTFDGRGADGSVLPERQLPGAVAAGWGRDDEGHDAREVITFGFAQDPGQLAGVCLFFTESDFGPDAGRGWRLPAASTASCAWSKTRTRLLSRTAPSLHSGCSPRWA